MLNGKRILLGVTGSIAAYKIPLLVRLLKKEGAEVKVILTNAATDFVTPATLSTVSENPVYSKFYKDTSTGQWNNHVELALWADLLLIAPLSANTMAKMSHGLCDNLLTAVYLSAKCPVMLSPAMDLDMYQHPTTQENISKLQKNGNIIIPADTGELASGLEGQGRMPEPETIFDKVASFFNDDQPLKGKNVTITAGPTYEKIDPVRFIGNFSSGKMGVSLAKAFSKEGAQVNLVLGPSQEFDIPNSIKVIRVVSADEMFQEVKKLHQSTDIFVAAAAVSDYRPVNKAEQKIKKSEEKLNIELVKNQDILAYVGENKKQGQSVIGFALETENELENAKKKLKKKNLDFIILNSTNDEGATFQSDHNKVTLIDQNNNLTVLELNTKDNIAKQLVNLLINEI